MRFIAFVLLVILEPRLALASSSVFAGQWNCHGTVVSIDDDDVKNCDIPGFQINLLATAISWSGQIACSDGSRIAINENYRIADAKILNADGSSIGSVSADSLSYQYQQSALDYAMTMQLKDSQLHFQHDRVSAGVPLLRWTFDCARVP